MIRFKGIVFGVDNTIVPCAAREVAAPVREAFRRLPDDVVAIMATGRTPQQALWLSGPDQLNLRHPLVVSHGAIVIDPRTGGCTMKRLMTSDQVGGIIEVCYPYLYPLVIGADKTRGPRPAAEHIPCEASVVYVDDIPYDIARQIEATLRQTLTGVRMYLTVSERHADLWNINIMRDDVRKDIALRDLFDTLQIDGSEMIAISGAEDDGIFDIVGHRIAVDNAAPELKRAADQVVGSCTQYGVLEALKLLY